MWNKQPPEESRLLGFANFLFPAKVGGHLLRCQKFWHLKHALVVFICGPSHGLCNSIRIHLDPCSLTVLKNFVEIFFRLSLNGDLEDITFKCRRPRNEWLNCLACCCRNPWSINARTRRHSKCYETKLIARLVLRQRGKIYWPVFQLTELVFFMAVINTRKITALKFEFRWYTMAVNV